MIAASAAGAVDLPGIQQAINMGQRCSQPQGQQAKDPAAADPTAKAGPDTSPLSQLNLCIRVPVTTQLISLIHSEMLKLS